MKQTPQKGNFITRDYRYVYLGGSLIALLGLSLLYSREHPYSFLGQGNLPGIAALAIFWTFLAVSGFALVVKFFYWKTYSGTFM